MARRVRWRRNRRLVLPDAAYARRVTAKRKRWLRMMWFVIPSLVVLNAFQWVLYVLRPTTGGLIWAILDTGLLVLAAYTWRLEGRTFRRMLASIDSLEISRMEFRENLLRCGVPLEQAELIDVLVAKGEFPLAWAAMEQFGFYRTKPDEPE